jgi:hypothetical protein
MEKSKPPKLLDALLCAVPVRLASSFAIAFVAWGLSLHYDIIFFPGTASSTDLVWILLAGLCILAPETAFGALVAFVVAAFAVTELWGAVAQARGAFILMCISIAAFLFLWIGLDDYWRTRQGRVSLTVLLVATRVGLWCFFLYLSYWLNQAFQNSPLG